MSKILIIGPAYPLRGGLATYNERLAETFNQLGHTCEISSFSLQYPNLLFPGKTQFSTDPAPKNLTIHTEINSVNPLNWLKVGKRIKRANYDFIVFRYWMSFMAPAFGTIARVVKGNKHTKILAITDNLIPHEQRFFDAAFTKYFISQCDGFLTMSKAVKSQLESWTTNKPITYTPHPMYDMFGLKQDKTLAKKQIDLNPEQAYLLFFGFIRQYKGLGLLLETMADERIRALEVKVIIAGEFYEDAAPYMKQIDELNLHDSVILRNDFIPNSQVSLYFSAADAVIQPYLNATQSGVTQIAYYYNTPMIVTNVGGLAELVPHNIVGYVCEVNKEALVKAVVDFYQLSKEKKFSLAMEGEKKKFTWETVCNELLLLAR